MKLFTALVIICPLWAQAFTLECPGKTSGNSFNIESQETIKQNGYEAFIFPENVAVNVTETTVGFTRHFAGHLIFQNVGIGVPKRGRMAHYIFKLRETKQQQNSIYGEKNHSLIMSINGTDGGEKPLECFWP